MVNLKSKRTKLITVRGVVQGVGFRPFVYRLAHKHRLAGWVRNTSGSVEIEVQGTEEALDHFLAELKTGAPPMAKLEGIETTEKPLQRYHKFEIRKSEAEEGEYQLVSPDIATCRDCQTELFDPGDRRYYYPFTNCTNCGPRFTIIKDIPYDRPKTTMRAFKMCPECQREYDDPLDRRFHAQPNACPVCGPQLELWDDKGVKIECQDVILKTAALLKAGKIVAIKGLGGFQLACDATSERAVKQLRERKKRPSKPFAVMVATIKEVRKHCFTTPEEERLLLSPQCPIVLLKWKRANSNIAEGIAPNNKYLGVMLPYTPLHHILLREINIPLVMTSGNMSEEPIAKDNDEAIRRLKDIADYFLVHNRDIYAKYDDSVYIVNEDGTQPVRQARGYAPYPVLLPFKARQILACGAEEKNTFCLTREQHAFISQHIGDLENEETLAHFETTIELYKRLFRIEPEAIAYDMHPEYLSTKYALRMGEEKGLRLVPVQHHHAHIASCLAENGVRGPVIGVAFDGTGYGTDGNIWGGEFLVCDWQGFKRAGHLEYVPMPGGAAAIKKPYRMALGYLYTLLGNDTSLEGLPILGKTDAGEIEVIQKQLERRLNSPLTSSAGRLFDAVSALSGVRGVIDYEAQAAIELEMLASEGDHGAYPFSISQEQGINIVRLGELIRAVLGDVHKGIPTPVISSRFHKTMAEIILKTCQRIAEDTGIKQVALSGGVFQNRLIYRLATGALRENGFQVLTHHLVPCNDGGLSLGQAVIAHFSLEEGK